MKSLRSFQVDDLGNAIYATQHQHSCPNAKQRQRKRKNPQLFQKSTPIADNSDIIKKLYKSEDKQNEKE